MSIIKSKGYNTLLSPSWNIITTLIKLDLQTCHDSVHSLKDSRKHLFCYELNKYYAI
jgi:hypothetical protein